MGHSFIIVNLDHREYLDPFTMPSSDNFPSLILNKYISTAMATLVCDVDTSQKKKFGFYTEKLMGSWNKNEIKAIDDVKEENLYYDIKKYFKNISHETLAMLSELDNEIKQELVHMGHMDENDLARIVGPIALLEKNNIQFELEKKFGSKENLINAYYKAVSKINN